MLFLLRSVLQRSRRGSAAEAAAATAVQPYVRNLLCLQCVCAVCTCCMRPSCKRGVHGPLGASSANRTYAAPTKSMAGQLSCTTTVTHRNDVEYHNRSCALSSASQAAAQKARRRRLRQKPTCCRPSAWRKSQRITSRALTLQVPHSHSHSCRSHARSRSMPGVRRMPHHPTG